MAEQQNVDSLATCRICRDTDEYCPQHAGKMGGPLPAASGTWLDQGIAAINGTWARQIRTDAELRARAERAARDLRRAIRGLDTLIAACVQYNDGLSADQARAQRYALLGRLAAIRWVLGDVIGESAVTVMVTEPRRDA